MESSKKSRYQYGQGNYGKSIWRMLPIVTIGFLVPIIVRQTKRKTYMADELPWTSFGKQYYEFFLSAKSIVLIAALVAMTLAVLARLWNLRKKKEISFLKLFLPLCVYLLMALLSSIFAYRPAASFFGGYEQFESIWVLFSYGMTAYYIFLFAETQTDFLVVTDALCASGSIVGIIGVFQGLGMDIFRTEFGQRLITTDTFFMMAGGKLVFRTVPGEAFTTLYNTNYVGVYGAMMIPFLMILFVRDKAVWRKIWYAINICLLLATVIFSHSKAGILTVAFLIGVILLFAARRLLKYWYLLAALAVALAVGVFCLDKVSSHRLSGAFLDLLKSDAEKQEEYAEWFTDMLTKDDGIHLNFDGVELRIAMDSQDKSILLLEKVSGQKENLTITNDNSGILVTDSHERTMRVTPQRITMESGEDKNGFLLSGRFDWYFAWDEAKSKILYLAGVNSLQELRHVEAFGWKDHYYFLTGRGFIWARTNPLLPKYLLLGCGPDNFIYVFPNDDFFEAQNHHYGGQVVTKPHCLYLQMAVQTGGISLLAFLTFYGWYAVWSLRLYFGRKQRLTERRLGCAALLGSLGYMISGLTNDSMVATSPVFWILVGLGIAFNFRESEKMKMAAKIQSRKKSEKTGQ